MPNRPRLKIFHLFTLITLALLCTAVIPRITEKGMFIDGLVYTTIAHNLSEGIGTFWQPILKNSEFLFINNEVFYDHPPLMFGIESIFFNLFGCYTESIYNITMLILLCLVMVLLFQLFQTKQSLRYTLAFLPIFFLFTIPEFIQKATYNLLDTTLAVFTSFAVYFLLRAVHHKTHIVMWALLGGICTVCAWLVKGPVGLFPLMTPFLYVMFFDREKRFKNPAMATGVFGGVLLIGGIALYAYSPSRHFFAHYIDQQVLSSIQGQREKANTIFNHLSILKKIFIQLSPMLIITLIIRFFIRKPIVDLPKGNLKAAVLLFVIGLSASLPIALSAKHHSFYLIPSFIFFSLAFATYLSCFIPNSFLLKTRTANSWIGMMIIFAIAGITIFSLSRSDRYYHSHREFLSEMNVFTPLIPEGTKLLVPDSMLVNRGEIGCYLERYALVELTDLEKGSDYYFTFSSDTSYTSNTSILAETGHFILKKWNRPKGK